MSCYDAVPSNFLLFPLSRDAMFLKQPGLSCVDILYTKKKAKLRVNTHTCMTNITYQQQTDQRFFFQFQWWFEEALNIK